MKDNFFERKSEQFPERVYCIESRQDQTVLWGMGVLIDGDFIKWFDGTKERMMKIKNKTKNNDGSFSFEREDGEAGTVYNLRKMTLDIYNEKVKNKLTLPEDYSSEEDMLKSFEASINSAW